MSYPNLDEDYHEIMHLVERFFKIDVKNKKLVFSREIKDLIYNSANFPKKISNYCLDDIISEFNFYIEPNKSVLLYIFEKYDALTLSRSNKELLFTLLMRIYMCVFFVDLENHDDIYILSKSLQFAYSMLPELIDLLVRVFGLFMTKLLKYEKLHLYIKCIEEFIKFTNSHDMLVLNDLRFCQSVIKISSENLSIRDDVNVIRHLTSFITLLSSKNSAEIDKSLMESFYDTVYSCLMEDRELNIFKKLILLISMELVRITHFIFEKFFDIISYHIASQFIQEDSLETNETEDQFDFFKFDEEKLLSPEKFVRSLPNEMTLFLDFLSEIRIELIAPIINCIRYNIDSCNNVNINMFVILLIYLSNKGELSSDVLSPLDVDCFFFSRSIFAPANHNSSYLTSLVTRRKIFSYTVYKNSIKHLFDTSLTSHVFPLISDSVNIFVFAENLFFIRTLFDFKCLSNNNITLLIMLIKDQLVKVDTSDISIKGISLLLHIIKYFLNDDIFCTFCLCNEELIKVFIDMLYNELFTDDLIYILCSLMIVSIQSFEDVNCNNFFSQIEKLLVEILSKPSELIGMGSSLLKILHTSLCYGSEKFYSHFSSMKLFHDIIKYIIVICDVEVNEITSKYLNNVFSTSLYVLLDFLIFRIKNIIDINWTSLSNSIKAFGVSEGLYHAILSILSYNHGKFTGINNIEASPLIHSILESEFRLIFLRDLCDIIIDSDVQCLNCIRSNLDKYIFEIVKSEETPKDEISLYLTVLSMMYKFSCNRIVFFRIMNHLDPIDNNVYLCKNFLLLLAHSASGNCDSYRDFIFFNTYSDNIKLQNKIKITPHKINSNITVSAYMLIDRIDNSEACFNLITFTSPKNYLSILVFKEEVKIISDIFPQQVLSIPVSIPVNRWFMFTIEFKNLSSYHIYIDGKFTGTGQTSCNIWNDTVSSVVMFQSSEITNLGYKVHYIQGFLSFIGIYSESPKSIIYAIDDSETDFSNLIDMKCIIFIFYAKHYSSSVTSSKEISTTLRIYKNISSLKRVFISSQGCYTLLYMLDKVDFNRDDSILYVNSILKCLNEFITHSIDVQQQMLNLDGFTIISYCLSRIKVDDLSINFCERILSFEVNIRIPELLHSFYKNLLIEFPMWYYGREDIASYILKKWVESSKSQESIFSDNFDISSLINISYMFFSDCETNSDVISDIFTLLYFALSKNNSDINIHFFIRLLEYVSDYNTKIKLLNLINNLALDNIPKVDSILSTVISFKDIIVKDSPIIFSKVVLLFTRTDNSLYYSFFIDCALYYLEIVNSSSLEWCECAAKVFLGTLVGIDPPNEITESLQYRRIYPQAFAFAILSIFYCSEATIQFSIDFINTQLEVKDNTYFLSNTIDIFSLFLFIALTLNTHGVLYSSLIQLIMSNVNLLRDTFDILDIIGGFLNRDFHDLKSSIGNIAITHGFNSEQIVTDIVKVLTQFIFIGINRSVLTDRSEPKICLNIYELIHNITDSNNYISQKQFGLYFENRAWVDCELAIMISRQVSKFLNREICLCSIMNLTYVLLCNPSYFNEVAGIITKILDINELTSEETNCLYLPITKVSEMGPVFAKKFEKYNNFSLNTFALGQNSIINFISDNLNYSSTKLKNALKVKSSKGELNVAELLDYINQYRSKFFSDIGIKKKTYGRFIDFFLSQVTPFFVQRSEKEKYKRYEHFDFMFRPIIYSRYTGYKSCKDNDKLLSLAGIKGKDFSHLKGHWSHECQIITVNSIIPGYLTLRSNQIEIFENEQEIVISGSDIIYVFWAYSFNISDSILLFLHNYKGYFIRFPGQKNHEFIRYFKKVQMKNCVYFQSDNPVNEIRRLKLVAKWKKNKISNFEYLSWLNVFSGRSYFNIISYPIFPMLFKDTKLDTYRDLKFNTSSLHKGINDVMRSKYNTAFDEDIIEFFDNSYLTPKFVNFLHSNVYPFSKDNEGLDIFSSYKSLIEKHHNDDSVNPYELTPEFFFSAEVFKSNVDKMKDSNSLTNIQRSSMFVSVHYSSLESLDVSKHINKWIDLIWGVNQRGISGTKHFNSFDSRLYQNIWETTSSKDEVIKYHSVNGNIPIKLFSSPHPARDGIKRGNIKSHAITNLESSIYKISFLGIRDGKTYMYCLLKNMTYIYLSIENQLGFHVDISNKHFILCPHINSNTICFLIGSEPSLILTSYGSSTLYYFDNAKKKLLCVESTPHLGSINWLASSHDTFVSGSDDGVVACWKCKNDKPSCIYHSLISKSSIIALCTSSKLGVIVILTSEYDLICCSLSDLKLFNTHKISRYDGYAPKKLIISEMMCCIVIIFEELKDKNIILLMNFTINCNPITVNVLKNIFVDACSFLSENFGDYVSLITKNNELVIINAYTLVVELIKQLKYTPSCISFNDLSNEIIVGSMNGSIHFIPTFKVSPGVHSST